MSRVMEQIRQHIAEGCPMARTPGHADAIYLPDIVSYVEQLEAQQVQLTEENERLRGQMKPSAMETPG